MAMYSRGTPGNSVGFSRWMDSSVAFSSNRTSRISFAATKTPTFMATVIPNEWKKGITHMIPSLPSWRSVNHEHPCMTFDTRLWWVSMAPFDRPVVPPV